MTYIDYSGSGKLYITDISTARTSNKSHLDRVITTCQDSIKDNVSDGMEYSFYCMSDGPSNKYGGDCSYDIFERASDELYTALGDDESVLIHCHHGTSRSVSVSAAALARLLNISFIESIGIIHSSRPRPSFPDDLLIDHAKKYISTHTNN